MMSVAAVALIAGAGYANAQGTGTSREGSSPGSTTQQSAPSSERGGTSATPMNRDATDSKGSSSGMKATQSDEKSPAGKNQRAGENAQDQKSKSMSSETDKTKGGKDMKAEGREDRSGTKAEGREDRGGMKAEGREDRGGMKTESREEGRSQTTGQAGGGAKLSSEQRTKISTVIKSQRVAPVTNANFQISVGARVPREVSFHPLPAEIVTIYPEWRGYEFILVNDKIVVVNPRTLEIVDVIDA
jgi:hypothetical protein